MNPHAPKPPNAPSSFATLRTMVLFAPGRVRDGGLWVGWACGRRRTLDKRRRAPPASRKCARRPCTPYPKIGRARGGLAHLFILSFSSRRTPSAPLMLRADGVRRSPSALFGLTAEEVRRWSLGGGQAVPSRPKEGALVVFGPAGRTYYKINQSITKKSGPLARKNGNSIYRHVPLRASTQCGASRTRAERLNVV